MAGGGALLGIACSVALGWGIYRGGVRINLSRFFRLTGLVLVLVAAGLVVTALHTANEAGWLTVGQGRTVDLSWLVVPGSPQSSVLTGVLGFQQHPTVIEVVGWLVYLVPVGLYVARPPGWSLPRRAASVAAAGLGLAALLAAGGLALLAPAAPDHLTPGQRFSTALTGQLAANPVATTASPPRPLVGETTVRVLSRSGDTAVVDYTERTALADQPAAASSVHRIWSLRAGSLTGTAPPAGAPAGTTPVPGLVFALPAGADAGRCQIYLPAAGRSVTARAAGLETRAGVTTRHYQYELDALPVTDQAALAGLPRALTRDQLVAAGGGRLPIGVTASQLAGPVPVTYTETVRGDLWVEPTSGTLVAWTRTDLRTAVLDQALGGAVLGQVERRELAPTPAAVTAAARAAGADAAADRTHQLLAVSLPLGLAAGGAVALLVATVLWLGRRRWATQVTAESIAPATKVKLG
jgi:high-affinity iron transporter